MPSGSISIGTRKRRSNTTTKGRRLQREAVKVLEVYGYQCETARPRIVWVGPSRPIAVVHDFFGRIDIIAVHPTSPPRLIQVTTAARVSVKRKDLAGWVMAGCSVEIWGWVEGRGRHFRVWTHHDGYQGFTTVAPV